MKRKDDWKSRYKGLEDIKIIKRGSSELVTIGRVADVLKVDGEEESPIITYAFTDETFDHCNDTFLLAGGKFNNYEKNNVCPWSHMSWLPPVANGYNPRLAGNKALIDIKYHGIGEFAQEIRDMAVARVIKAVSQGCLVYDWKEFDSEPYVESGEANPLFDTCCQYTDWELMEVSPCTLPMLPTALVQDTAFDMVVQRAVSDRIIRADGAVASMLERLSSKGIAKYLLSNGASSERSSDGEENHRSKRAGLSAARRNKVGREISDRTLSELDEALLDISDGHAAVKRGHTKIAAIIERVRSKYSEDNEDKTMENKKKTGDVTTEEKADPTLADIMAAVQANGAAITALDEKVTELQTTVETALAEDQAEDAAEEQDDAQQSDSQKALEALLEAGATEEELVKAAEEGLIDLDDLDEVLADDDEDDDEDDE